MIGWAGFALIATFAAGIQNFLYKVAAERGCNSATLMTSFIAVDVVLATAAVFYTSEMAVSNLSLFLAFAAANAALFVIKFLFRQEALKLIPLVIGIPLSKMSAAVAAGIGIVLLGESVSIVKVSGIMLSLVAVWILSRRQGQDNITGSFRKGMALILLVVLAGGLADLVVKLASTQGNNFLFIAVSHGMMFFPALLLQEKFSSLEDAAKPRTLKWGAIIGVFNFVSFSTLLAALQSGPMAVIFPMTTLGIALSVALSAGLLGEKLTRRRITGLLLALVALILLNI